STIFTSDGKGKESRNGTSSKRSCDNAFPEDRQRGLRHPNERLSDVLLDTPSLRTDREGTSKFSEGLTEGKGKKKAAPATEVEGIVVPPVLEQGLTSMDIDARHGEQNLGNSAAEVRELENSREAYNATVSNAPTHPRDPAHNQSPAPHSADNSGGESLGLGCDATTSTSPAPSLRQNHSSTSHHVVRTEQGDPACSSSFGSGPQQDLHSVVQAQVPTLDDRRPLHGASTSTASVPSTGANPFHSGCHTSSQEDNAVIAHPVPA
ncbi:hypothetical protein SCHPADRAFT_948468, partial [Schizopora paradoxa]